MVFNYYTELYYITPAALSRLRAPLLHNARKCEPHHTRVQWASPLGAWLIKNSVLAPANTAEFCGRTGHMRCGQALRLDQWSKSHYQVMNACRAWAKGAVCHWLRPPCSHTRPSPLTSQVSKRTAWILFDLCADPRRGEILGPHQGGCGEISAGTVKSESHRRLQAQRWWLDIYANLQYAIIFCTSPVSFKSQGSVSSATVAVRLHKPKNPTKTMLNKKKKNNINTSDIFSCFYHSKCSHTSDSAP